MITDDFRVLVHQSGRKVKNIAESCGFDPAYIYSILSRDHLACSFSRFEKMCDCIGAELSVKNDFVFKDIEDNVHN